MTRIPPLGVALLLCLPTTAMYASTSLACSCAPAPDAAAALAGAHTVFEGKVVQSNAENAQAGGPVPLAPGPMLHRFQVLRSWKGEPTELVTVRTPGSAAACGRSYRKGQTYLVYASIDPDGLLRDTLCTRTRSSAEAQQDIASLDGKATAAPAAEPARVAEEPPPAAPPEPQAAAPPEPPPASPAEEDDDLDDAKPGCTVARASQQPGGPSLWLAAALVGAAVMRRRTRD
jgi:MYXO-CTERM domain-containing protein